MKKNIIIFGGLIALFTACNPKNEMVNIDQNALTGKWRLVSLNGTNVLTDDRTIYTFDAQGMGTQTASVSERPDATGDDKAWHVRQAIQYTLYGNRLDASWIKSTIIREWKANISSITDSYFITEPSRTFINTIPDEDLGTAVWQRVPDNNYEQDIVGLWEGIDGHGPETYGDWRHRWLYIPGVQYFYLSKDPTNKWVVSENALNKYDLDGNYMACRWQASADSAEDRECWDITIQGDEMRWDALRANKDGGAPVAVDMVMKRISPTKEQIAKNLKGKWITIMEDDKPILTNRRSVHTFNGKDTVYYTVADTANESDWHDHLALKYDITGSYMVESGWNADQSMPVQWRSCFESINQDTTVVYAFSSHWDQGKQESFRKLTLVKIEEDYADDVIGIWIGEEGGGDYGTYKHIWQYNADGTYLYYNDSIVDGKHVWRAQYPESVNNYLVDGNWLVSRWWNDGFQFEMWDLKLTTLGSTTYMEWTGLRSAGGETNERYFKLKKIDKIPDEVDPALREQE